MNSMEIENEILNNELKSLKNCYKNDLFKRSLSTDFNKHLDENIQKRKNIADYLNKLDYE